MTKILLNYKSNRQPRSSLVSNYDRSISGSLIVLFLSFVQVYLVGKSKQFWTTENRSKRKVFDQRKKQRIAVQIEINWEEQKFRNLIKLKLPNQIKKVLGIRNLDDICSAWKECNYSFEINSLVHTQPTGQRKATNRKTSVKWLTESD